VEWSGTCSPSSTANPEGKRTNPSVRP